MAGLVAEMDSLLKVKTPDDCATARARPPAEIAVHRAGTATWRPSSAATRSVSTRNSHW